MTQGFALAHFLGGALLFCALILVSQRHLAAMISLYRAQAAILCAAALAQSLAQHSADLFLTAIITLSFNVILLPRALRRILHRFNLIRAVETALPLGVCLILGVALIGVAMLAVRPGALNSPPLADLAIALSVMLLGFLMMATMRNALAQAIGFLSIENGLVLAAISLPGMPFVAEIAVALLALAGLLVFGIFTFRLREHFDRPDPAGIEETERPPG
jgi:hydrogenase-4 component E